MTVEELIKALMELKNQQALIHFKDTWTDELVLLCNVQEDGSNVELF